jgi:hypothetical protein
MPPTLSGALLREDSEFCIPALWRCDWLLRGSKACFSLRKAMALSPRKVTDLLGNKTRSRRKFMKIHDLVVG